VLQLLVLDVAIVAAVVGIFSSIGYLKIHGSMRKVAILTHFLFFGRMHYAEHMLRGLSAAIFS